MRCSTCGSAAELRTRDGRRVWACISPTCDSYVGCHPGTDRPLGSLANAELRGYRMRAHAAFDELWRSGRMSRADAYRLLAEDLGIRADKAHIGSFDIAQCKAVIRKWAGSDFEPVTPGSV